MLYLPVTYIVPITIHFDIFTALFFFAIPSKRTLFTVLQYYKYLISISVSLKYGIFCNQLNKLYLNIPGMLGKRLSALTDLVCSRPNRRDRQFKNSIRVCLPNISVKKKIKSNLEVLNQRKIYKFYIKRSFEKQKYNDKILKHDEKLN